VRLVSVAGREADVFDFFIRTQELGLHLVVRGARNRNVLQPGKYWWEHLSAPAPAGQLVIEAVGGQGRRRAALYQNAIKKVI
jgi:hypothetical protein